MNRITELQLEGLVGSTHNYAGLSFGNKASAHNRSSVSHPKAAALQSLNKMKEVARLGIPVAIMPPQPRPAMEVLTRLGYQGSAAQMLKAVAAESPDLLANVYSASSMWCANAATVSPSCDSADGKVHFTPANLISSLHRSIETRTTTNYLRRIFAEDSVFTVHDALPVTTRLADEGAANHMRLESADGGTAFHLFVYGASPDSALHPAHFPARQQKTAFETIARMHQLAPERVIYLQQTPEMIDAGVFHNDVIAMSHRHFLCFHESAYVDSEHNWQEELAHHSIQIRQISSSELPLDDAVQSYFFNAQLLDLPEGGMVIFFPQEVAENPQAKKLAEALLAEENPIREIRFMNLRESMRNGGGPACLRLRVPLSEAEIAQVHHGVRFTDTLYQQLGQAIEEHYPDTFELEMLSERDFMEKSFATHQILMKIIGL